MADEWFVRVQGKEYGPVDLETLREWKAEGRLIPQNELRAEDDGERWVPAAEFPEIFGVTPPPTVPLFHRRTFGQIIGQSLRIYARGFFQFFVLSMFVGVPSLAMQISFAFTDFAQGQPFSRTTMIAGTIGVISIAALLVCWPIFIGGLQFLTAELAAGRKAKLRDTLRQTVGIWPRIARLCLVVYGSYIFWTLLPIVLIISLAVTQSLIGIFVALLALGFQVYMASRLFVNFMFWQQSCTIAGLDTVESLTESKELARSRGTEPAMQRPLWRGAILASIWMVVLIAVSVVVEMPSVFIRLRGITSIEEGVALIQQLNTLPPDALAIATDVASSLINTALHPLLGIAFVILYFDAKSSG